MGDPPAARVSFEDWCALARGFEPHCQPVPIHGACIYTEAATYVADAALSRGCIRHGPGRGQRRRAAAADSSAPCTGYALFVADERDKLQIPLDAEIDLGVAKQIASRWNELTAAEKAVYIVT